MGLLALPATPAGRQLGWFIEARATGGEGETAFRDRMVDELYADYAGSAARRLALGPLQAIEERSPFAITARYLFSQGFSLELTVEVEEDPPHRLRLIQSASVLEGGGSPSALAVAANRAVHRKYDPPPLVLDDDLAEAMVGPAGEPLLVPESPGSGPPWQKTMVVVRTRISEDEVTFAARSGPLQYVILGAGLDTFAYRRRDLGETVTVFEVDEPEVQSWKRRRLAHATVSEPPNVVFVPVDFTSQNLNAELANAGFEGDRPTVVSCTGVTYYLTAAAMENLAQSVGRWCTRAFVADYMLPYELLGDDDERRSRRASMTRPSEPMRLFFTPQELEQLLKSVGMHTVEHFGPGEIAARFGEAGHLPTSPTWRLICARREAG